MASRGAYRIAFAGIILVSAVVLANGYVTGAAEGASAEIREQATDSNVSDWGDERIVQSRDNVTVITTDSNTWLGQASSGPRAKAELVAFNPDGSVLYYNASHTRYWDVDPVPEGETTVLYAASDHLSKSECSATTVCTRNVVERLNLTTGNVTTVYARITPHKHSTRWHDVDRVNETHLAVADIARDRVFVVNTTSGVIEWEWDAQSDFSTESGGPYPRDWTHVNDVEVLADGRIMASLRNQDQVVFLNRSGLIENWTLGSEDDYDVLYEQHNPDYIPAERGGPAVVVADSENNRVVEYQRDNGTWNRTWQWQDVALQWPRDADRLPNAHTLIADSNGNRVLEVDADGDVVWSVDIAFPYEVERLGTGDESAGGPSATSADIASRAGASEPNDGNAADRQLDTVEGLWLRIKQALPGRLLNAVMYVVPVWVGAVEIAALTALVVSLLAWGVAELRWSSLRAHVRSPVSLSRKK